MLGMLVFEGKEDIAVFRKKSCIQRDISRLVVQCIFLHVKNPNDTNEFRVCTSHMLSMHREIDISNGVFCRKLLHFCYID